MADAPMLPDTLALLGAPGSPYTRKLLAVLRYRHIPYRVIWGHHRVPPEGLPAPKVKLLPTVYFPQANGSLEAVVDTTPIIARLENARAARSVRPADPVMAFLDALLEDFGDEWLTKAMFHYRWAHQADIENAGPLLIFWGDPTLPDAVARELTTQISRRQIDRLYVVGSNDTTAETIEASYRRLLDLLDGRLVAGGYALGKRPATADFALFGQLTQLGIVDPTPTALLAGYPRLRAWLDRMEDLSGLEPQPQDWLERAQARALLGPLLGEVGRVYAPFLLANARAAQASQDTVDGIIDGRPWRQPVFPYQVKCLLALRAAFEALSLDDRQAARGVLEGTGCEALFD